MFPHYLQYLWAGISIPHYILSIHQTLKRVPRQKNVGKPFDVILLIGVETHESHQPLYNCDCCLVLQLQILDM